MSAFQAKAAGNEANALMKQLGIKWVTYQGKRIEYLEKSKGEFYHLIWNAEMAKLNANPAVRDILKSTGTLTLKPDHLQGPDSAPAWLYHQIWMDIRTQM